jgi:hypothetical protein
MGRVERRDDAASRNGTPNRVARHARRNDGGKCGRRNGRRRRAARSACYPAALTAAPVGGRGAREGPRRAARWPRCTVAGARLPAGTASRAADSSDSSSASCLGAAIASRGGRAGTMVGKCGRLPHGAHPIRPRRSRRQTTGGRRRNAPILGRGARDGPRRAAGWPGVPAWKGHGPPARAACRARPNARTPPALAARAWSSRRAACAGTMVGKCSALRAARIPIASAAAAAGTGACISCATRPAALGCAGPRPRRSRWARRAVGRPVVRRGRRTPADAGGCCVARLTARTPPARVAWAGSSFRAACAPERWWEMRAPPAPRASTLAVAAALTNRIVQQRDGRRRALRVACTLASPRPSYRPSARRRSRPRTTGGWRRNRPPASGAGSARHAAGSFRFYVSNCVELAGRANAKPNETGPCAH